MIPLNVRWIAQTEISIAEDSELLELMAASGCQWIVVGFESVSQDSLKGIEDRSFKKRRLPAYPANIRRIQDEGIGIYGTFIVGLDGDDLSIFQRTADFILQNALYGANITVPHAAPWHGSAGGDAEGGPDFGKRLG